jgi:hypothetical protein
VSACSRSPPSLEIDRHADSGGRSQDRRVVDEAHRVDREALPYERDHRSDFDEDGDRPSHRGASPAEQGPTNKGRACSSDRGNPRASAWILIASIRPHSERSTERPTRERPHPSIPPPCTERSAEPSPRGLDCAGSRRPVSPNDQRPRRSTAIAAPVRTPGATGLAMPNATTPVNEISPEKGSSALSTCAVGAFSRRGALGA